jgi:hypothetical protein
MKFIKPIKLEFEKVYNHHLIIKKRCAGLYFANLLGVARNLNYAQNSAEKITA